ncbi:MAG: hypothetical protein ACYTAF_02390, partial [Planctomycetota bacterium]
MRRADLVRELKKRLPEILPLDALRWKSAERDRELVAHVAMAGRRMALVVEARANPTVPRVKDAIEKLKGASRGRRRSMGLLVAPHLGRDMRSLCRRRGQAYLDLSGNAWLRRGSILIEKEVARSLYPGEPRHRSLFADKASVVLRHLLSGRARRGKVRGIARATGLSAGYVSKVVRAAVEQGYAEIDRLGAARLKQVPELLSDWCAFYSWRRNARRSYRVPSGRIDGVEAALRAESGRCAVTLHSARAVLDPSVESAVWHVYAADDTLAGRLGLEEVRPDRADLVLMRP